MDRDEYYEIIHDLADEGMECDAIQDLANEMWKKINGYERRIAELKRKTNETKGMIKREDAMMYARPEYLSPDQIGHEEYNKGWNDAVKAYWDGLKELKGGEDE